MELFDETCEVNVMILCNLHTHCHFCDGSGEPREYVEAAIERVSRYWVFRVMHRFLLKASGTWQKAGWMIIFELWQPLRKNIEVG